jgi:uncharacterized membrane protein YgcG
VKSLQGGDVETYANQLFRFWKLGEAKKNNGVLLWSLRLNTRCASRSVMVSKVR